MEYELIHDYISIMSMIISLAAVIIGPIVTLKVARRQVISPMRQKWLNDVRELMSDFLSECQQIIVNSEGKGLLNAEHTDNSLFRKLLYLEAKLRLLLNQTDSNHDELIKHVQLITEDVQHGVIDIIEFGRNVESSVQLSQVILKTEWDKVKNGKV